MCEKVFSLLPRSVKKSIVDFEAGYAHTTPRLGACALFAVVKIFDALKLVQAGAQIDELIVCFQPKGGITLNGLAETRVLRWPSVVMMRSKFW